ncbi:low molecular weight phosphatase family protein [Frigoribacterium sp. CFBP9039]|uniref:arsenate reductase/protein-tyrosine-phosphatase family protein n=1 Tax=Frigoribacterium sp. CFBP9029 TaxID=3096541 RepID=UPI002A6AA962|nr:low molecular weight phosphatase family protein [Frigoribacterium sp. CFBP9039]MDY0946757.1 low molecular weight phosphatase family protein [Frigoribacterium sp. CFBP9039]
MSFDGADAPSPGFSLLTVCTGNICRSPLAELHLARELAGLTSVSVSSAGTMAVDDDVMPEQARALARSFELEPDGHRARFLFERDVRDADLVIALAREHRRAVVAMHPRASRYTFTLREAARLARDVTDDEIATALSHLADDASEADRLRAVVELLASRRGTVEAPEDPLGDDVVDPYRRSDETFAESGRQLVPAADVVADLLRRAGGVA